MRHPLALLCARIAFLFLAMGATAGAVRADDPKPSQPTEWNAPQAEKLEALRLEGDPRRGEQLYQTCASCHGANGVGQRDGTMPELAGQHPTVLIKQLSEIRSGQRVNPVMLPFAMQLDGPRDIADVVAYIARLPLPADSGATGPGVDLERGKALFQQDCARCHGEHGEGVAASFYPRIGGQHYRYVVRQLIDVASGRRGNAHPEMARVIGAYTARDVSLVGDYVSRLGGTRSTVESSAERTEDGLYRIRADNARPQSNHVVYLKPGAELQRYTEVIIDPFMVSYAVASGEANKSAAPVRTLDPADEARFTSLLRSAFVDAMGESRYFRVVEEPGPTALRVQGWIYELTIEAPYRDDPRNFPLCAGQMNLILNVRDSRTAEPLARVDDRLAISCKLASNKLYYYASWPHVKSEVRSTWGSFLRGSLDSLHELPDLPTAPH